MIHSDTTERTQEDFPLKQQGEMVEIFAISFSHSDITSDSWQREHEDEIDECEFDELSVTAKLLSLAGQHASFKTDNDESAELVESDLVVVPSIERGKLSTEIPTIINTLGECSPSHTKTMQKSTASKDSKPIWNRTRSVPRGGLSETQNKTVRFRDEDIDLNHGGKSQSTTVNVNERRSQSVTRGLLSHSEVNVSAVQKQSENKKNKSTESVSERVIKPISRNTTGSSDSQVMRPANLDLNECPFKRLSEPNINAHDRLYFMALKKQQDARHKIEAHNAQIESPKTAMSDKDRSITKKVRPVSPRKTILKDLSESEKIPNLGKFCNLYDQGMRSKKRLEELRMAAEHCASPSKTNYVDSFHPVSKLKNPPPRKGPSASPSKTNYVDSFHYVSALKNSSRKVKMQTENMPSSIHDDREENVDSVRTMEASRE